MAKTLDELKPHEVRACRVLQTCKGSSLQQAIDLVGELNTEEVEELAEIYQELQKPPIGTKVQAVLDAHTNRLIREAQEESAAVDEPTAVAKGE